MSCEFCGDEVAQRLSRVRFQFKGETIYIEGVPAWVCGRCIEVLLAAPVYKRLEQIARRRNRIEDTICFPLADYQMSLG